MTQLFYVEQIDRLRRRFGAKAFDVEIVKILGREVSSLPEDFFKRSIDTWIASRKTSNPPMLAEFRECRLAFEKGIFKEEVRQATKSYEQGRAAALQKEFNVGTVEEAYELAKLKIRLGGANGKIQGSED